MLEGYAAGTAAVNPPALGWRSEEGYGFALAEVESRRRDHLQGTKTYCCRARAAVCVLEEAHAAAAPRPPGRPGGVEQDPDDHQGRPAADPAGALPRRVLHPAAHQGGRVLALGRRHR